MALTMVDRAYPPTADEVALLKNNGVTALALYVGGVNNGGRAWKPEHAALMRKAFQYVLPIYVGENACENCKTPVALTRDQGTADGQDAVACAQRYGFPNGPLCLDVEYDTYQSNVAGALAYMEAWSFAVERAGYLPVHYAITRTATDYLPQTGHPTGLWIANWDRVGDLSQFPHAERFAGIGWQYDDNWSGFDVSHVDGRWWTQITPAPEPTGPLVLPKTQPDPWFGTSYWIPTVFVQEVEANGGKMTVGLPLGGAAYDPERDQITQWFERSRLELNRDGSVTRGRIGAELLELLANG